MSDTLTAPRTVIDSADHVPFSTDSRDYTNAAERYANQAKNPALSPIEQEAKLATATFAAEKAKQLAKGAISAAQNNESKQ